MTTAFIVTGSLFFLAGAGLFWLNLNTPVQTGCLPAALLSLGAVMAAFGLGGALL